MASPLVVKGIALSEQEAAYRPVDTLVTDIQSISCQTAGKIFVALEVLENYAPFALKMIFDGVDVEINQNEDGARSTLVKSDHRIYEAYAVDLPMRLVTVRDKPHSIQFRVGRYVDTTFIEDEVSNVFHLHTPTETPVIDPKVAPEDQD